MTSEGKLGWVKTMEVDSVSVLETRCLKSGCQRGWFLLQTLTGRLVHAFLPSCCWPSSACGHVTSVSASVIPWLSSLRLRSPSVCLLQGHVSLDGGCALHPGWSHLKILN